MARPVVLVCGGSDCRKRAGARRKLVAAVEEVGEVQRVRCQDICSGPVAGVVVDGRLEWFRKVRGGKLRSALVEAAEGGRVRKRLREVVVKKRRGRLRT